MSGTEHDHRPDDPRWVQAKRASQTGDYESMLAAFKSLAQDGEPTVLATIGEIYERGTTKSPRDGAMAVAYFRRGIEAIDDPICHAGLGRCLFTANGIARDFNQARLHFEKADQGGVVIAQLYLGRIFFYGLGVQRSIAQAEKYLSPLLKLNYVNAHLIMAKIRWSQGRYIQSILLRISASRLARVLRKENVADQRLL